MVLRNKQCRIQNNPTWNLLCILLYIYIYISVFSSYLHRLVKVRGPFCPSFYHLHIGIHWSHFDKDFCRYTRGINSPSGDWNNLIKGCEIQQQHSADEKYAEERYGWNNSGMWLENHYSIVSSTIVNMERKNELRCLFILLKT